MEVPSHSLQNNVDRTRGKIFTSNLDPYSFLCPSAYDTAWLAMIPDSYKPSQPMFKNCLNWLINNQNQQGFWGESDAFGKPTLESLTATLASIVALKMWVTGALMIQKGLVFIETNIEKLLKDMDSSCPCWFTIVFPAMVQLSKSVGIEIAFPDAVKGTVSNIFQDQQNLFDKEELVGKHRFPPLLSYLEALPPSFRVSEEDIYSNLRDDGSVFQSPSATAKAFMVTGKIECLAYLQSLIQRCPDGGVPQTYPMDEDLIKLCMVNHIERLGLGEHFVKEIEEILTIVYRNYVEQQSWVIPTNMVAAQLHKDSLAFQLLRMHGYSVSPSLSFGWFLNEEIRTDVEKDPQHLSATMLSMYRASNLIFSEEYELEEVKSFSRDVLRKTLLARNGEPNPNLSQFQQMVELELNIPWLARLDHLDHRTWIEKNESNFLWREKYSHVRISDFHNTDLLELAMQKYEFKQSIFKNELEEIMRWSQSCGLTAMRFAREKTAYCYYAVAAATTFSDDSYVRILLAKSAIMITVADDFFDVEGSLNELEDFTNAAKRWDSRGLSSHGKVIFDALDNLISEVAAKYLEQGGTHDIKNNLQDLWYETFFSWLIEAKWNKNEQAPSIDDYMKNGMISIATHTMILPASYFLNPSLTYQKLSPDQYETITKLLMVICRLLNDIQSYQREIEERKWNFLLLNSMMKPNYNKMEDSIAFWREIIDKMTKEFLQHVLVDGQSDLPKPSKLLHLTCLKVFQMFYNSSNAFDSNTQLLEDINKAIYLPLSRHKKHSKILSLHSWPKMKQTSMQKSLFSWSFKHNKFVSFGVRQVSPPGLRNGYGIIPVNPKASLPGFI